MNPRFKKWAIISGSLMLIGSSALCLGLPNGGVALFTVGIALWVHLICAIIRSSHLLNEGRKNLNVISRTISDSRTMVGRQVEETFILKWTGKQHLDLCIIEEEQLPGIEYNSSIKRLIGIPKGKDITIRTELTVHTAGKISMGAIHAVISEDWGLFEARLNLNYSLEQVFYPLIYDQLRLAPQTHPAVDQRLGIHKVVRSGEGSDLHEIRDYHTGDPFRKVLWGATAKTGKLMIREFETDITIPIMFVLNTSWFLRFGSPRMMFDHLLESALGLAHAAKNTGDPFGFTLYGDESSADGVSSFPPALRHDRIVNLLNRLLDVPVHKVPSEIIDIPQLTKGLHDYLLGSESAAKGMMWYPDIKELLISQGYMSEDDAKEWGKSPLRNAALMGSIADSKGIQVPTLQSRFKMPKSVEISLELQEVEQLRSQLIRLLPQVKGKAVFVVAVRPYLGVESTDALTDVLSQVTRLHHSLIVLHPNYPSYVPDIDINENDLKEQLQDAINEGDAPSWSLVSLEFYMRRRQLRQNILNMGGRFESIESQRNVPFILDRINELRKQLGGQNV